MRTLEGLRGRDFLKEIDVSVEEWGGLVDLARVIVFDQAENRLHTIKAVLVATLGSTR